MADLFFEATLLLWSVVVGATCSLCPQPWRGSDVADLFFEANLLLWSVVVHTDQLVLCVHRLGGAVTWLTCSLRPSILLLWSVMEAVLTNLFFVSTGLEKQ